MAEETRAIDAAARAESAVLYRLVLFSRLGPPVLIVEIPCGESQRNSCQYDGEGCMDRQVVVVRKGAQDVARLPSARRKTATTALHDDHFSSLPAHSV